MSAYKSNGTRVACSPYSSLTTLLTIRRPFVASLAGVLLGILPAAAGEPKGERVVANPTLTNISGALVIVGGGKMPDTIRDCFLQLAHGKDGHLVVIPTASEFEDRRLISYEYWQKQGLKTVTVLHTLDPKKADDPVFVKPLTEATAAWLSGGDQSRLAKAYRGTLVERELRNLLKRGGVVGGTSAGASVMSNVMIAGGNPQAHVGEGFGFLPDVVIDQHFENRKRQKRLLGVLEKHPHCLGLGIDEQTAVIVRSGYQFKVLGDANVVICMPPTVHGEAKPQVLKDGDGGDLFQLHKDVLSRLKVVNDSKTTVSKVGRATTP